MKLAEYVLPSDLSDYFLCGSDLTSRPVCDASTQCVQPLPLQGKDAKVPSDVRIAKICVYWGMESFDKKDVFNKTWRKRCLMN